MNKISLLISFLAPVMLFAQDVKKIEKKDKETRETEVYYVLKSDGLTRHGTYKKLNWNKIVMAQGNYDHGAMEGEWREYTGTGDLLSKGNYHINQRAGIWEFYDSKGVVAQKYDFDKKELVFNGESEADQIKSDTTPPVYLGGDYGLIRFLQFNIRYPQNSRDNDIQGRVLLKFVVKADGNVANYQVVKGVAEDLDAEAMRVAKLLQGNWIPASAKGKPIDMEFNLPIVFKLYNR
jgi:TonB family protein